MGAAGTIWVNRTQNCPLEDIKSIKKKNRSSNFQNSKNLRMARWNDNSVVILASKQYSFEPVAKTKRWSNNDKKIIRDRYINGILCLNIINLWEAPIIWIKIFLSTGVPHGLKMMVATFLFTLEVPIQNALLLYRLCPSNNCNKIDLLQFRREICQIYFSNYKKRPNNSLATGKPKTLSKRVSDDVRNII
ncbi:hypothetical protein NPIL_197571 [Nephila pilipes]|uniref:Uncharacterized protein n=1 Tax=Nephila pilipes TaxID=299642 RepID=A0A8X6QM44_NEPPI|nr:hypothetical protein NPIL_197571 [Nephila pilipes]